MREEFRQPQYTIYVARDQTDALSFAFLSPPPDLDGDKVDSLESI
jgi:hypothetical protein